MSMRFMDDNEVYGQWWGITGKDDVLLGNMRYYWKIWGITGKDDVYGQNNDVYHL